VCSIFWTQSMVPDERHRETLYQLDQTIQKIRAKHGETDETVSLAGHYHNLLRMWSEI
jgi:PKHD-type hydroxylase